MVLFCYIISSQEKIQNTNKSPSLRQADTFLSKQARRVNRTTQEIIYPPLNNVNWENLRDNDSMNNYKHGLQMAELQLSNWMLLGKKKPEMNLNTWFRGQLRIVYLLQSISCFQGRWAKTPSLSDREAAFSDVEILHK